MAHRTSRCVFVGNIPYDATEEQLKDIFSEVGPVVSFRLVFDRDSGKPKGYGFCEYRDAETALSAMRNLNNTELSGRTLRVDFAENERGSADGIKWDQEQQSAISPTVNEHPNSNVHQSPVQKPETTVENTVAKMSQTQLYEVLWNMKNLIKSNPDQAKQILKSNPQFACAILQAQLVLGLVDPNAVKQAINPGAPSQPISHNAPFNAMGGNVPANQIGGAPMGRVPHNMNMMGNQIPSNVYVPQNQYPPGGYPPSGNAFPPQQGPPAGGGIPPNFPPNHPPENVYNQPGMGLIPGNYNEEQAQIILQVLNLTPQQFEACDPKTRQIAHQLQQQFGQGGRNFPYPQNM